MLIKPRSLEPGSRVALVAPAGPVTEDGIARAVARVEALGWIPILGQHAASRTGYLAGNDSQRATDLHHALTSLTVDAVWCLRGGYGTMRILDAMRLETLRDRPIPLIGFSDNTVLHLRGARLGVVTFHGPHPAAAQLSDFSLRVLSRMLTGAGDAAELLPLPEDFPEPTSVVGGVASGPLVGGNLALLAATVGTDVELIADGAILFFEDVGEPLYRLDRLLTQLLLAGALDSVAGIAVGAITDCEDEGSDGYPGIADLLFDRLGRLGVPVVFGFPFGHVADNWTVPVGVTARLDSSAGTFVLLEKPVVP